MAFDAYFLTAVLDEIREKAIGARVEKIHQPSRDTVILLLRCEQGREKLLFAANPAAPRLHMTTANPENPPEPPMFCMLLRKHLQGARLASVTQPPMERAATFRFDCTDEMGYPEPATCTSWVPTVISSTVCGALVWTRPPSGRRYPACATRSRTRCKKKILWNGL